MALIQGSKSIVSFKFRLDPKQQKVLPSFTTGAPGGPWLVRGVPGSGKSTLALYCASDLAHAWQYKPRRACRPKVLFVTYTNSLTMMSEKLVTIIAPDLPPKNLEGVFPVRLAVDDDGACEEQCGHDLRLLHVACSRASRSLFLLVSKGAPSRFLQHTTTIHWDKRCGEVDGPNGESALALRTVRKEG